MRPWPSPEVTTGSSPASTRMAGREEEMYALPLTPRCCGVLSQAERKAIAAARMTLRNFFMLGIRVFEGGSASCGERIRLRAGHAE